MEGGSASPATSMVLVGKNKDLAGMNEIWILDPVPICPLYNRIPCAIAIDDAADTPQAVAARHLGHVSVGKCRRGYALFRRRMASFDRGRLQIGPLLRV